MNQDEKEYLIEILREQKLSFEKDYYKSLLNLSAGALAISISVVQIFSNQTYTSKWLLLTSWISLILALSTILAYFISAPFQIDKRIQELKVKGDVRKQTKLEGEKLEQLTNYRVENKKITGWLVYNKDLILQKLFVWLGYACTVFFIIGILSLSIFTINNVAF